MTLSQVLGMIVLYFTTCTSKMEPFILGGEYAKIENYPHSVFLYMLCEDPQACGGSILTQQVILTAAHCFERCFKKHNVVAYAGSEDTDRMLVADSVVNFRIHKEYNTKTLINDIALAALKTPVKLGRTIKRVIIRKEFPGVTLAHIAGWGIVDEETGAQTKKLKMVTQIIQQSSCQAAVKLKYGMLCATNSMKNHPSRRMGIMEPYIVGGNIATIEQFPHAVYMFLTCVGESWICGGSILTQNLVLSAAHCFKRCHRDLDVNVYVGSANIYQMPVARYVSAYMLHRTYDASSSRDDIALARTEKDLPLGRTIRRVAIERAFPRVTRAQVAGWGLSNDGQLVEKGQLQWLSQWIRPGGILCSKFQLSPGMMCVENNNDNRPSHGDSGCALMANSVHQIGLVSFRHPEIVRLIVYTNISYYYDWIQRSARQLSCTKQ